MKAWLFILVLLWPLVSVGQTGADRLASKGVEGAIVGAVFGALAGLIGGIIYIAKRAKRAAEPKMREIASKSKTAIGNMSKSKEEKLLAIDDEFFATASDEILQGTQVKGLWAKALALADGDEKKQKAIYVRLRAKKMSDVDVRLRAKQMSDGTSSDDVHESQARSSQAGKATHIVDRVKNLEKEANTSERWLVFTAIVVAGGFLLFFYAWADGAFN